jgi:hypothetical protein
MRIRGLSDREAIEALLYARYRRRKPIAQTPQSAPIAGVLALAGLIAMVTVLALFLWAFAFVSSVF